MSEYISKEELKDYLEKNISFGGTEKKFRFYDIIDSLPSADVRPNIHGHWMKINSGDEDFPESIVCDRCNHENSHLDFNEHNEPIGKVFVTSNFCPNCGADMREPKGEKGTE